MTAFAFVPALWGLLGNPAVLNLVLLGVGLLAARVIRTPADHERAALLARIANDAAALVVSTSGGKPWSVQFQAVVKAITTAAGVPTSNAAAIERAAAAALLAQGAKP